MGVCPDREGTAFMHELPRKLRFSETYSQNGATLYVGTGVMRPFAPVEYLRSRHLATLLDGYSAPLCMTANRGSSAPVQYPLYDRG
jgi:hypothetical protein